MQRARELKAAELLLEAGGFGLVVIDFGAMRYPLAQSAALRLARAAERSGGAVLAIAERRVCGTFAALTLAMERLRACFSRAVSGAPTLFDGLRLETSVARNKLGVFGHRTELFAALDPSETRPGQPFPAPLGEGRALRLSANYAGVSVASLPRRQCDRCRAIAAFAEKREGEVARTNGECRIRCGARCRFELTA